jgi:hypothetical protein
MATYIVISFESLFWPRQCLVLSSHRFRVLHPLRLNKETASVKEKPLKCNGGRDVRGSGKGPRLRCCKDPAELPPLNVIEELVHSLPQMAEQGQAPCTHFLPF